MRIRSRRRLMLHRASAAAACVALLCGCDGRAPAADNGSNAKAAPAATGSAGTATSRPAAPGLALAGDGLQPGLSFGMPEAEAIAGAGAAFGPATDRSHNEECGEGPMDFVSFHDLQLGFQGGKLAGWSLAGRTPALSTAGGLAIGTPRVELGDLAIDEESSLGPEFSIGEVGGVLGDDDRVAALWAGLPCQFR